MWPFGRKNEIDKNDRHISIPSIGFHGPFSASQNGRYIVAWCDFDYAQGVGGFRKKGKGSYVLLEKDKVILKGKIQRPNEAHVADNGTFVINDWMFGEGLKGTFYAIDCKGKEIIKRKGMVPVLE